MLNDYDVRDFSRIKRDIEEREYQEQVLKQIEHEEWLQEQYELSMRPHRPGFEKDYSFLMESGDDEDEKPEDNDDDKEDDDVDESDDNEDTDDNGSDDSESGDSDNDDLADFGNHGDDSLPNNEYDPKEVETLNNLAASEADAMNEYLDAARDSKVDVLQRLYADIANEERFHLEQLLFAKSELTGEKYVPRDKDVRKEYEELLELGMDEDSAMATAVDKVGISVKVENETTDDDVDELNKDMQKIAEDAEMLEQYVVQLELISHICEYADRTNDSKLINELNIYQESFIMEDIAGPSNMDKDLTRSSSPIKIAIDIFKAFLRLVHKIAVDSQRFSTQIRYRIRKTKAFVNKHGIGALFQNGVEMYTWNDKQNTLDLDGLAFYNNALWQLCQICVQLSKTQNQEMLQCAKNPQPFIVSNPNYNKKFGGPKPIVDMMKGLVLTKAKVLVNDNTTERLDKLFFGNVSEQNIDKPIKIDAANNNINLMTIMNNSNACIALTYACARIERYAQFSTKIAEGFGKMEGEPNGIYHTNNKLYKDLCTYMEIAGKYYTKMIKIVTNDINVCANIASGKVPNMETTNKDIDNQQTK